jgi:DNA adenine methylase
METRKVKNSTFVPFLKWAGGKRWLVDKHCDLFHIPFDRFIEPFLGSGAVFFSLSPEKSILCDKNIQLINTYRSIRDEWQKVELHLRNHHKNHNNEYYYKIRAKDFISSEEKAAQFIYLNRTCWNGLYRVNLKGKFNVPIGTKKNVVMDTDDFEKISNLLINTQLIDGDFNGAIDQAGSGDFVFIDPPYTVKHNHNGFVKYNENLFSWDDQIRLRDSIKTAIKRGAMVLVTNANHDCIKELYLDMGEFISLSRASVISGSTNGRGKYEEMVIKCF